VLKANVDLSSRPLKSWRATGEGVLAELAALFVLPYFTQDGSEVLGRRQRVGVVVAQDPGGRERILSELMGSDAPDLWMWIRPRGLQPMACRGRRLVGSDASCRLCSLAFHIACCWPSPARDVTRQRHGPT
jgi:hypothetical protein